MPATSTSPTAVASPLDDTDRDQRRHAVWVTGAGSVGALIFVVSTVVSIEGAVGPVGYLLLTALAMGLVGVALGFGHLWSPSATHRATRRPHRDRPRARPTTE